MRLAGPALAAPAQVLPSRRLTFEGMGIVYERFMPANDENENKPAGAAQRRTMYVILSLPVVAVVVILGIGTYAQWGKITPRWKVKDAADTVAPAPAAASTNAAPTESAPE